MKLIVKDCMINQAKKQIYDFEKIKEGQWRYANVEAWRGIVCEFLTGQYLELIFENYDIEKKVKGLDDSGLYDDCDMIINGKKIEIKSATKNYFKYIMPKVYDIQSKPKDIYIGSKYNETLNPNEVIVLGYLKRDDILNFPIKQNKGAPYYEVPIKSFKFLNTEEMI